MRQEYHYTISRTDRICLVVFVTILMTWELVKYVLPSPDFNYLATPEQMIEEEEATPDISDYYYPKYERKPKKKYPRKNNYTAYAYHKYEKPEKEDVKPAGPVEIMTATIDQLVAMGFSRKVAYNITKYISSGAKIRHEKDLMKIYGMDSVQLHAVLPYIIFPGEEIKVENEHTIYKKDNTAKTTIDLNHASVEELEALPGIGMTLAERIIKFRESLGGFTDKKQLKDCYGIAPELYDKLESQLIATGTVSTIKINQVDILTISHPYLPKKFLRVIRAYKDHHGPFENESDLKQVFPHDSMWCERLLPYVSYEMPDINVR